MKKSLMIVVALLAIAGLMAAMAYTSATVTSYGQFEIKNTDEAMLAFIPGADHGDYAKLIDESDHWTKNASKKLDLDLGIVQSQSVYKWNELFRVQNNTNHWVEVKIELDPEGYFPQTTPDVYFQCKKLQDGRWFSPYFWGAPDTEEFSFILGPNDYEDINVKLDGDKWMSKGKYDFKMIAHADRIEEPTQ